MGKFFKQANIVHKTVTWPFKKAIDYKDWAKANKVKAGGSWAGWIIEPGYSLKNYMNIKTEPNTLDEFMTFGFPTTALLQKHKKNNPELYLGTKENQRLTEKKWESRGHKGIRHSIREGY